MSILKCILFVLLESIIKYCFIKKTNRTNSVVIIKLDLLGDYILFRNFIECIKKSNKYQNHNIILIGNEGWKNLSEKFEKDFISDYIWVNKTRFNSFSLYRFQTLLKLKSIKSNVVINPTFSRVFFEDSIVNIINSNHKIGFKSDNRITNGMFLKISNTFYTKIISFELQFEFENNKKFIETILEEKIILKKPFLKIDKPKDISIKNICIGYGASEVFRIWHPKRYAQFIETILEKDNELKVALLGTKKELKLANEILSNINQKYKSKIIDYSGKLNLNELIEMINQSFLLVANESGLIHTAVALNTNVICIGHGNCLSKGRFYPYPKEVYENINYIFPNTIGKIPREINVYDSTKEINLESHINSIASNDVIDYIQKEKLLNY